MSLPRRKDHYASPTPVADFILVFRADGVVLMQTTRVSAGTGGLLGEWKEGDECGGAKRKWRHSVAATLSSNTTQLNSTPPPPQESTLLENLSMTRREKCRFGPVIWGQPSKTIDIRDYVSAIC